MMGLCLANSLLAPGAGGQFASALLRYPPVYDELLAEVRPRLVAHGAATKNA
jgi:hypothetical protein